MAYQNMNSVSFLLVAFSSLSLSWAVECPDRWVTFQDSCYLFGHEVPLSFVEAEHFCQQHHGGHLVHVNSADENLFIVDFLRMLKVSSYWLGLTDENVEGIWKWYDTDEVMTFSYWLPGEPNNEAGEDCVEFKYSTHYNATKNYHWNDVHCDLRKEPICELSGSFEPVIVG